MADYITTYTGIHFYPMSPNEDHIHIEDIAHALSLICRGNGHVKTFFSVGQHCINCAREAMARGYSDRMILACLLHDASECYMSDVPRPFKKMLGEYIIHEHELLNIIYRKYLGTVLSEEEEKQLKQIDDDLLYYDLKELLQEESDNINPPVLYTVFNYEMRSFESVEEEYLDIFHTYYKGETE